MFHLTLPACSWYKQVKLSAEKVQLSPRPVSWEWDDSADRRLAAQGSAKFKGEGRHKARHHPP